MMRESGMVEKIVSVAVVCGLSAGAEALSLALDARRHLGWDVYGAILFWTPQVIVVVASRYLPPKKPMPNPSAPAQIPPKD
jgi:hypothetical protein